MKKSRKRKFKHGTVHEFSAGDAYRLHVGMMAVRYRAFFGRMTRAMALGKIYDPTAPECKTPNP